MYNKISSSYISFVIMTTLWSVIMFALPDFFDNFNSVPTIGMYLCAIGATTIPLVIITTVNKYIATAVIPLYAILGSIVAYFRVAFHATVTVITIDATLNTTPSEAYGVITIGLFLYIILNLILAVLILIWRYKLGKIKYPLYCFLLGLLGLVITFNASERILTGIFQRYPYNIYYYGSQYVELVINETEIRDIIPAKQISSSPDSLTVILILGESMRSDHLSINGYYRPTTPRLAANHNIINMGDVWSTHTNTRFSVPHILTPANENYLEWGQTKESIIPYYKEKGFYTAWISNQDMGKGYSYFINSSDTVCFVNGNKSVWVFDKWTDEDLLQPLENILSEQKSKNLFILHTIGAHWYYDMHYTEEFKKFTPTTTTRIVTNNSRDEVINSYDNCVVFMDYITDSIFSMLSNRTAIVIYQSDHAEGLGEKGAWLHACEGEKIHHPAGFIWYSDKYKKVFPENIEYIEKLSKKKNTTDYVFPLMLRIIGLSL